MDSFEKRTRLRREKMKRKRVTARRIEEMRWLRQVKMRRLEARDRVLSAVEDEGPEIQEDRASAGNVEAADHSDMGSETDLTSHQSIDDDKFDYILNEMRRPQPELVEPLSPLGMLMTSGPTSQQSIDDDKLEYILNEMRDPRITDLPEPLTAIESPRGDLDYNTQKQKRNVYAMGFNLSSKNPFCVNYSSSSEEDSSSETSESESEAESEMEDASMFALGSLKVPIKSPLVVTPSPCYPATLPATPSPRYPEEKSEAGKGGTI